MRGASLKDEIRREQLEAMKTVMVGDRIRDREIQFSNYYIFFCPTKCESMTWAEESGFFL
ncbi:MAG: hypothetical protein MRZ65_10380 [Lachnospiraceae bacterium]|nr:hypothetical protein [Lachnospiraceae bacterium]